MHSQLLSAQGNIFTLESLLTSRKLRLGSATRIVQFQGELHRAQEKISSVKWSFKGKGMETSFEVELR